MGCSGSRLSPGDRQYFTFILFHAKAGGIGAQFATMGLGRLGMEIKFADGTCERMIWTAKSFEHCKRDQDRYKSEACQNFSIRGGWRLDAMRAGHWSDELGACVMQLRIMGVGVY
jgi:hypothetical protein